MGNTARRIQASTYDFIPYPPEPRDIEEKADRRRPAAERAKAPANTNAVEPAAGDVEKERERGPKRIAILEWAGFGRLMLAQLYGTGHDIFYTQSKKEFWDHIVDGRADLILVHCLCGDVYERLRGHPGTRSARLAIIDSISSNEAESRARFARFGAARVFRLPIMRETLLETIDGIFS